MKKKRAFNRISRLKVGGHIWVESLSGSELQFREHFMNIYGKEDKVQVDVLLRQIGSIQMPCITTEQKQSQNQEFSFAEVEAATMQLGPLKAPGPNGTPALFFQRYWDVTSTTVASARCQTSY